MLNLASNAEISSNATCGDPEPEVYCKLVEHVPGRRIKNPHCPKCDANSVLSKGTVATRTSGAGFTMSSGCSVSCTYCTCSPERHPVTNAIDGTNQWWQSPSIKNGRQFHWVTVTLDLKQVIHAMTTAPLNTSSDKHCWSFLRSVFSFGPGFPDCLHHHQGR